MTPDMRKDLRLQAEFTDRLAVRPTLLGRSGGSKFDVFDAEGIEGFGDRDLGPGVEEGVGELLALWLSV